MGQWEAETEVDGYRTWVLIRRTPTGGLGPVQTMTTDLTEEMMPLERVSLCVPVDETVSQLILKNNTNNNDGPRNRSDLFPAISASDDNLELKIHLLCPYCLVLKW